MAQREAGRAAFHLRLLGARRTAPQLEAAAPVSAVAAVRPEGLDSLYRAHWNELVRYARRSFGAGPPDPEDVAQTAFVHFAALARPQDVHNPRAFLFRAARNSFIDQRRRLAVRARAGEQELVGPVDAEADDCGAERVIDGKRRIDALEVCIAALPERMRTALILHRIDEKSYAEIARHIGVSQTEAKRLVAKAVLHCARALRDLGGAR